MLKISRIAGFMLFATLSAAAFADSDATQLKVGDKVSDHLIFGKKKVSLPVGEWVVAGTATQEKAVASFSNNIKTAGTETNQITLFIYKAQGGVLQKAMYISNLYYPNTKISWKNSKNCDKSETAYFWTNFDSGYDAQECLKSTYITNFAIPSEKNKWWTGIANALKEAKIKAPLTMPMVEYNNLHAFGMLQIAYYTNPELDGFKPATGAKWVDNEWNKAKMSDAQKKYIDSLTEYGKTKLAEMGRTVVKHDEATDPFPDFQP